LQSRSDAEVEACQEGFKKSIKMTADRPTSYQKGGTASKINDDHNMENDSLLKAGIYTKTLTAMPKMPSLGRSG
jgi:hypothetical protein